MGTCLLKQKNEIKNGKQYSDQAESKMPTLTNINSKQIAKNEKISNTDFFVKSKNS